MKLLLDTHIWIWSLLEPGRLTKRVVKALESKQNELWLSPISVWETLILVERGRIILNQGVHDWLAEARMLAPMKEALMTTEIAIESRRIKLSHQDPADRFLAATAKVLDLTLVTSDRRLMKGKGFQVLPNR